MKRFNTIHKLFLLLLSLGCIMACEQKIALDLDEYEGKIVVQSILEPGKNPQVFLTKSRALLGFSDVNTIEFVKDAEVSIRVDGQSILLDLETGFDEYSGFTETPGGYYHYEDTIALFYYTTEMDIEVGKTYELSVNRPGQALTASTTVPNPVEIDELVYEESTWTSEWGEVYTDEYLKAIFTDVEGQENFYVIEQSFLQQQLQYEYEYNEEGEIIGEFVSDTLDAPNSSIRWYDIMSDEGLDGYGFSAYVWLPSQRNYWQYPPPDIDTIRMEVKLRSISPELGRFYDSLEEQDWNDGDPTVEPVRIWSNIEGGLGIFGSLGISEARYYDHIVYFD